MVLVGSSLSLYAAWDLARVPFLLRTIAMSLWLGRDCSWVRLEPH